MTTTEDDELATTAPEPLPTPDVLLLHSLRVAVREAAVKQAQADLAAARHAAQIVYAPARRHGQTQVEVTVPGGTKIGLVSIRKGETVRVVDEPLLASVIAGNDPADFEDYIRPAALTDPEVLAVLAGLFPQYVSRRVTAGARALYDREIDDNGGLVLDRMTGERVRVATIEHLPATGEFAYKPVTKAAVLLAEALAAGLIDEYGDPAPQPQAGPPAPAPEPSAAAAAQPAAEPYRPEDEPAARYARAMKRSGLRPPQLHPPTAEQAAVLAAVATRENVAVRAFAGTGKTTTLQHIGLQEDQRRGLYLAFGRDIVDDARAGGKFTSLVRVSTAHGLAFGAVGKKYKTKIDNGEYVPMRRAAAVLRITSPAMIGDKKLTPASLARLALQTVERFCQSADPGIGPQHVPARRGLDSPAQMTALRQLILPWAARAWEDLTASTTTGDLRFEHQHYLKLWQLGSPRIHADYIMFDEAQDADPVILDVVRQQAAQIIPVGDDYQAIHEWRGAVNALDQFDVTHDLPLTQSFRFGAGIAAEANKWLAALGAPRRVRGWDRRSSMVTRLPSADAILCRSNTGAMGEVVRLITAGEKTALAGGDQAAGDLRRLAEAAAELQLGRGTSHPELVAFQTWHQVQEFAEDDADGTFRTLVRIVDEHTPAKIIEIIGDLRPETDASVIVSTAHKAKGREWDSVRIAEDFREPAGTTIDPEEGRLAYVAVTRARLSLDRGSLAWIDGFAPEAAS